MTDSEKAIEILQRTNDGDDLSPKHLWLVEVAVNGGLSELGKEAFDDLHKTVMAGTYKPPWFHDIEGLTINHNGYVFWRGKEVEHYSFNDPEASKKAATRLARKCLAMEAAGIPITIGSVLNFKLDEE